MTYGTNPIIIFLINFYRLPYWLTDYLRLLIVCTCSCNNMKLWYVEYG